jgi:hypothetical protein
MLLRRVTSLSLKNYFFLPKMYVKGYSQNFFKIQRSDLIMSQPTFGLVPIKKIKNKNFVKIVMSAL